MARQAKPAKIEEPEFQGAFDLMRPSIRVISVNLNTLIGLVLMALAPILLLIIAAALLSNDGPINILFIILAVIAGAIILSWLFASFTFTVLKSVKDQQVSIAEVLEGSQPYVTRAFGLMLSLTVIYVVSLILLIVPYFFMLRRYLLSPYYMLDHDLSVSDALKRSAADSQTYSNPLWSLIGVEVLISVLGYVPLIGWLVSGVAGVLYSCAPVVRYQEIKQASKAAS